MDYVFAIIAIVLALVAMSRSASAAAEIRKLTLRLNDTERKLRAALRGDVPIERAAETTASEAETAVEPETRADDIAQAVSRLAEERAAARAEIEAEVPAPQVSESTAPPPLPAAMSTGRPAFARSEVHEPAAPRVREWLKRLGPNDPNMTWEMALGTYWLPRIGAIALAAAIVFLLSLAFQKWGPPIRVGLGYTVSAALLGFGWRLDRKVPAYARVLTAAGLALTYFVTFATYFVPYAKLFDSPYVPLAGLAAIVVVWAAMAQRRASQILAGITLGLGHITIALTTYAVASPGPFTVAGIVFLSVGGAFFLARNGWYIVSALGMLASYANHFYLMTQIDSRGTPFEFAVGLGILSTYFAVYTAAELAAPEGLRRDKFPFWFRNAFAVTNTLAFLLLGTALFVGYDFARDQQHVFRYGLAIALLIVAVLYLRLRAGDPLYNTYFVKGISAATWGLATQFDAHTLSTSLAIEVVLLLFAARRTGLTVTRILAYGVGALAFGQALYSLLDTPAPAYGDPGFVTQAIQAAVVVTAFAAAAWLYRYTDWSTRSPSRSIFNDETNALLWQLDLFAALPEGREAKKPLGGHLYPYLFSAASALLGATYIAHLAATHDEALITAVLALGFVIDAVVLRMRAFGFGALILFAATIVADIGALWDQPAAKAIPMVAILGLLAFATESRYVGKREGLALFHLRAVPYVLYAFVALAVAIHISTLVDRDIPVTAGVAAAAVLAALAAIPLHRRALAWCAVGLLAWAQLRWAVNWEDPASGRYIVLTWALIAAGVAGERFFAALRVSIAGPTALTLSAFTFAIYIAHDAAPGWIAVGWAAGGIALLAFAGATHGRTAAALGVIGLAGASMAQIGAAFDTDLRTLPLVLGFVAPALGWIALERGANALIARVNAPATLQPAVSAFPAIATALLALMLYTLPYATTYYLTLSWCALAIVVFILAVAFREKIYRYSGLALLGLATARAAVIDTRQLEALPRVFALGGLGLVLLALGYAYVRVFARSGTPEIAVAENGTRSAAEPPR